ncbi:MAG: stage IV sporulation protein A [Clostridia bacterium]|nr:stage IV sporulation protein A [Clostridia bacterium]
MENYSVYEDIANRTGGDIYIGVVGPVRTGKSTFIKRFMETLVIPTAKGGAKKVMTDELPQAAGGRTVMTTEPKFVPAKAAKISVTKGALAQVRLVDCVGFAVEGASGFEEDGAPRLVKTPWDSEPMPFEQAAELGTQKVIREHSTIGVLVTTDGSITEIPRKNYESAEERAVEELKLLDKPFVILLNCVQPQTQTALKNELEHKYGVPVVAMNVETMEQEDILSLLQTALFEFPVTSIDVKIPKWLQSLPEENGTVAALLSGLKAVAPSVSKMRNCSALETLFEAESDFINSDGIKMDLGTGRVELTVGVKPEVFYRVLSESSGEALTDDLELMRYVRSLSGVKKEYEKVSEALKQADESGYGIVNPCEEEYSLEKPQLVKKGASYGVKFRANATSYHIVKVNVSGAVNPIIGTKEQSEEFIEDTLKRYEESESEVWETNIFGKSLRLLVNDELMGKTNSMPTELRRKIRRTVGRIVNEGKGNVICILF